MRARGFLLSSTALAGSLVGVASAQPAETRPDAPGATPGAEPPTAALPPPPAPPPPPTAAPPAPPPAVAPPRSASPPPPASPASPGGAAPAYPPRTAAPIAGPPPPPPAHVPPPIADRPPAVPVDAAARASPFLDGVTSLVVFGKRFDPTPVTAGLQGGAFLGGLVRATGRFVLFGHDVADQAVEDFDFSSPYEPVASDAPAFLYGGTLGLAIVRTRRFVVSPGVAVARTNVGDYGTLAAVSLPFEWVRPRGMRITFEVDVGRVFGGIVTERCTNRFPSGADCDAGSTRRADRDDAAAVLLQLGIGWGLTSY